jgi:hypothetical protein
MPLIVTELPVNWTEPLLWTPPLTIWLEPVRESSTPGQLLAPANTALPERSSSASHSTSASEATVIVSVPITPPKLLSWVVVISAR